MRSLPKCYWKDQIVISSIWFVFIGFIAGSIKKSIFAFFGAGILVSFMWLFFALIVWITDKY